MSQLQEGAGFFFALAVFGAAIYMLTLAKVIYFDGTQKRLILNLIMRIYLLDTFNFEFPLIASDEILKLQYKR